MAAHKMQAAGRPATGRAQAGMTAFMGESEEEARVTLEVGRSLPACASSTRRRAAGASPDELGLRAAAAVACEGIRSQGLVRGANEGGGGTHGGL
ncbi:hypothetical protein ACP70R_032296 [Stipagrostis hirtigluma subsp. patula]